MIDLRPAVAASDSASVYVAAKPLRVVDDHAPAAAGHHPGSLEARQKAARGLSRSAGKPGQVGLGRIHDDLARGFALGSDRARAATGLDQPRKDARHPAGDVLE